MTLDLLTNRSAISFLAWEQLHTPHINLLGFHFKDMLRAYEEDGGDLLQVQFTVNGWRPDFIDLSVNGYYKKREPGAE